MSDNAIRLLYITDTHFRGKNPVARKDNYVETIFSKLGYIKRYVEENDIDMLLHGGDWLDTPTISDSVMQQFVKKVKEIDVPIAGVLGNHDLYGQNPVTFERTSFGIAEAGGLFKRLYIDEPLVLSKGTVNVSITGQDSIYDMDKYETRKYYTNSYVNEQLSDCVNIHIIHGMLVTKPWDLIDYTLAQDITDCNADIILSGHDHQGFGVMEFEGKTFCNPGALLRVSASVGDVNRNVNMALITISKDGYNVEVVPLPEDIAKPSNLVIDRESLLSEKSKKRKIDEFLDRVSNAVVTGESVSVYDTMEELAVVSGVENAILSEAKEKVKLAEIELNTNNKRE